jgi:hypothetical protein
MSSGMPNNPYSSGPLQNAPMSGMGPTVPNYLVQSILVTICCCIPFGIVAIVYAAQVNSKAAMGDYEGARTSSNNAKKWCWIALITGIVVNILATVVQFLIVGATAVQQQGMNGI